MTDLREVKCHDFYCSDPEENDEINKILINEKLKSNHPDCMNCEDKEICLGENLEWL